MCLRNHSEYYLGHIRKLVLYSLNVDILFCLHIHVIISQIMICTKGRAEIVAFLFKENEVGKKDLF